MTHSYVMLTQLLRLPLHELSGAGISNELKTQVDRPEQVSTRSLMLGYFSAQMSCVGARHPLGSSSCMAFRQPCMTELMRINEADPQVKFKSCSPLESTHHTTLRLAPTPGNIFRPRVIQTFLGNCILFAGKLFKEFFASLKLVERDLVAGCQSTGRKTNSRLGLTRSRSIRLFPWHMTSKKLNMVRTLTAPLYTA